MATGQVVVEFDVSSERCSDHNQPIVYSCESCLGEFACSKCVISTHNGHKFGEIQTFISEQRFQLFEVLDETDDRLKQLALDYDNVKERMDINESASQRLVSEIEERGRILKAHIDEIVANGRQKSEKYQRKNNRRLTKALNEIADMTTELKRKSRKCRKLVASLKYADIKKSLKLGTELKRDIMVVREETSTRSQNFKTPSTLEDIAVLEKLFGKLQIDTTKLECVDLKLKSTFQNVDNEPVYRLCPVMDGNCAWVSGDECVLNLFTFEGIHVKKLELDSGVNDLGCFTQSNDLTSLVVACEDNSVRQISPEVEGETMGQELFQFESDPSSIAFTAKNDMVIVATNQRKPIKVDVRGRKKPFVSGKENDLDLTEPNTVRVNPDTGDLAILNNNPGYLYVCDEKLNMKFKYLGQETEDGQLETEDFDPQGVTFDRDGNIVVADQGRKRVILLNRDGHFLKTLITRNEQEPTKEPLAVELYQESTMHVLWVGYSTGKIETYNYTFNSG
ncbi:E3 ubiquitin-protein ligase TRIM71-like [Argopecten irradians]|uniref:E3 ubiquitin-protein ligase TRIM71-like n=1 Tax=Argopecten irradians TaxID=31199 RepID=UPI00372201E4